MVLGGQSLQELSIADFQSLVANGVPEGPFLDYKQTAYSGRAKHIREMLRDVAAFANAEGGYLVMGIAEDGVGRASHFTPIDTPLSRVQAIRHACLDGLSERIGGLEVEAYELSPGRGIIVVHVPPSDRRPHMVVRDKRTDFIRRYGTDKQPMKISEIRNAVMENPYFRRMIELELVLQGQLNQSPERVRLQRPYAQLITTNAVAKFLQRYFATAAPRVLVIVSPFISALTSESYSLEDLVRHVNKHGTRTYVITTEPKDVYHSESVAVLEASPFIELRFNPDVHAKLYVAWHEEQDESFALFGSGNLTTGGVRHNLELGMMILSRGPGKMLVRQLYEWGSAVLRTRSRLVKAIEKKGGNRNGQL